MGKLFYIIGYILFNIYFRLVHNWKIKGKNNLPERGQVIVVANHISALDPPLIGSVLNRHIYFMAKEELFSNPLFGWVFKKIGVFPVKRGKPDRKALKRALEILKQEKVLGLFPEGTRHKEGSLGEAKAGAILIALKSRSPIVPVGIKNINSNSHKTSVAIGKPFTLEQYYDKKLSREEKKEAGAYIMNKIQQQINSI